MSDTVGGCICVYVNQTQNTRNTLEEIGKMSHYDVEYCVVCGKGFALMQSDHLQDTCVACRMLTEVERWCIKKERETKSK